MNIPRPLRFTVFVLLPIFAVPLLWGGEAAYELGGRWDVVYRAPNSPKDQTHRRNFQVATDGTNLIIRVHPGNLDGGIKYQEFGVSEQTGYEFVRLDSAQSGTNRARNDATLTINPNPVPRGIGSALQVWGVFAAHREWQERTMDYLRPINPVWIADPNLPNGTRGMISENLLLRSEWKFNETPPKFMKMFVNYRDGQLSGRRLNSALLPDELKTGTTNSRIDVLSWTNVSGLAFPLRARLVQYVGDTNSSSGSLVVQSTQYFEVTNVVLGTTRRRFIPDITPATRIVDYRAATEPHRPAEYYSTNATVIEDPEQAIAEMERQREESRRRREERKKTEALSKPQL